jgi:hypothetical protein
MGVETNTTDVVSEVAEGYGPARKRYDALMGARELFLIRARRMSRLTVPCLFRELGANDSTNEILPWQSLGAYCVNNLAARLTLTLFPPGIPCVKLEQTRKALQDLNQLDPDTRGQLKAAIDLGLSRVEQDFADCIEEDGDRFKLFDGIRKLIVGGSHGFHIRPTDGVLIGYPMEQFITLRDHAGTLVEFVINTPMVFDTLPDDIQEMMIAEGWPGKMFEKGKDVSARDPISVFTHYRFKRGKWRGYQEVWGKLVPGSEATYDVDSIPYFFPRWIALANENYGRSGCEDLEADLQSLDGLWQIVIEASAAVARLVWLVKPGGVTSKKQFSEATNGQVITGDPEEVKAVISEKMGDLQVASQKIEILENRLEKTFIVNSSIQRNGERVTAEEIRMMGQELETTMGGVYSNQTVGLQTPYAKLKMAACMRHDRLPKLPKGTVKVTILTGDAGLGRMKQGQTLDEFIGEAVEAVGQNSAVAPYINISTYLTRKAASMGIDTDGLVKSEQEVQQQQQAEKADAMTAQVAPEVVRQGGQMLQNVQQQQAPQGAQSAAPQPQPQGA